MLHSPQMSVPPQWSSMVPQLRPSSAHVVGEQLQRPGPVYPTSDADTFKVSFTWAFKVSMAWSNISALFRW